MTNYEWMRWATLPIMPVHLQTVRRDIKALVTRFSKSKTSPLHILDVGGRKSPYTIGLTAEVSLLDVPQEAGVRHDLNLGFTKDILNTIKKQRSNIKDLVIQDMTNSTLTDGSYDAVVCVEVIEHVTDDEPFVANISKVIQPGGWAYFTTPNGDYIKNEGPGKNPDHVRHYTRNELKTLLECHFDTVNVHYAVKTGKYRVMGLKSFKITKPIQTLKSIVSNIINNTESKGVEQRSEQTAHLVAIAFKK